MATDRIEAQSSVLCSPRTGHLLAVRGHALGQWLDDECEVEIGNPHGNGTLSRSCSSPGPPMRIGLATTPNRYPVFASTARPWLEPIREHQGRSFQWVFLPEGGGTGVTHATYLHELRHARANGENREMWHDASQARNRTRVAARRECSNELEECRC